MSTIVYQETLQSCYDNNKTIEPMSLSLKLTNTSSSSSSKQPLFSSLNTSTSSCSNRNTWSAIESLSLTCQPREQEPVYIHPLSKKSSCILSDKSLEMCTESLGNETGSCIIENDHLLSSPRCQNSNFESRKIKAYLNTSSSSSSISSSSNNRSCKFPPPLTTMSGSNPIQVKTYREDGRLVLRVESAPPSGSCLRAERSDGRLKLSFVRDRSYDHDSEEDIEVDQEHDEQGENYKEQDDERNNIDENVKGSEGEEISKVNKVEENVIKLVKLEYGRVKMDLLQYKWGSRCKEGGGGGRVVDNERLINWESFWVATT